MHVPNSHQLTHRLRTAALAGLFTLSNAATGFTAMVPLPENTAEIPGLALDAGTTGLTGTVIAAQDSLFQTSADFRGILRSMVVDTGLGYDFYYQLVNTGTDLGFGADFFRMKTMGGFDGMTVTVSYRSDADFTGLNFAGFSDGPSGGAPYSVGTKSIFSADRDVGTSGSVGFDYSPTHFLFDAANINPGETSRFAVIHTDATSYLSVSMDISGIDTARIASFAVVPEPQAAALLAIGSALLPRRRAHRW